MITPLSRIIFVPKNEMIEKILYLGINKFLIEITCWSQGYTSCCVTTRIMILKLIVNNIDDFVR